MTRLEHLNALNKGLSEYKSMCKGLQEQLDQLRNIREVSHVVNEMATHATKTIAGSLAKAIRTWPPLFLPFDTRLGRLLCRQHRVNMMAQQCQGIHQPERQIPN